MATQIADREIVNTRAVQVARESAAECERVKRLVVPRNEENFDRREKQLTKML